MQDSNASGTVDHGQSSAMSENLTPSYLANRFTLDLLTADDTGPDAGQEVIDGLTQHPKALPPKFFYDDRGSELFEQITQLPEYYLTRTETGILKHSAAAIATLTGPCDLIELGSGSSTKTRFLLDAYQQLSLACRYIPVDVSGGILESSAKQLLHDYPDLQVHGLVGTYEAALQHLPPAALPKRMIAFIGSTLGNLSPARCAEFLQQVADALNPGDYFLLGVDLHKARDPLEAAYNDSQGITVDFNLNMLSHLNWRFGGNFNLSQFEHQAFYNAAERQVEIYIKSLIDQQVTLSDLDLTVEFSENECLLSEISRKFDLATMPQMLGTHQLKVLEKFTDEKQWFGLILSQKG
ncbi:MAG: L-histidine N(alpha)-methyltransferase [Cyanobacteria bacterium J06639_16]